MRRPTGAGELDQRVSVLRLVETVGEGGTLTQSETTLGTVWAKVEPVRGQERVLADQERGVQTYRITTRNAGVWKQATTDDKLLWRGIKMNVKAAPDAGREAVRVIEAEAGITP